MKVETRYLSAHTRGHSDVVDLTEELCTALAGSGMSAGTATLFVTGSTASLSTIELEPGAVKDLKLALEKVAPEGADYHHHRTWGDDNGSAHVRACLMGPSLVVPFRDRKPLLGTWQQVVLVDFDTRPRDRRVVAQLMGE